MTNCPSPLFEVLIFEVTPREEGEPSDALPGKGGP
jgi:hypothetical protein